MKYLKGSCLLLACIFCFTSLISQIRTIPCEPLIRHQAILGEGSLWDWKKGILYWIDIDKGILYTYDPEKAIEKSFEMGQQVGTVVPIDTGGVLVALKDGVYSYDLRNKQFKMLVSPEKQMKANRFNDGKCDPQGRFWVGSTGPQYQASLYKISFEGTCSKMLDSVSTSNGLVWTKDQKIMYYIDTNTGCVRGFDYNPKEGLISHPRIVIRFPQGIGYPDGMTIDKEGMLWIAHWGGYCVGRWNPLTGKMIEKVEVPAPNVTSCSFGGKGLKTLFITTASTGMSQEALEKYPRSGNVFMAHPHTQGVKAFYFKTRIKK